MWRGLMGHKSQPADRTERPSILEERLQNRAIPHSQAKFKLYYVVKGDLESSLPPLPGCWNDKYVHQQTLCMWCWGLNPGRHACQASTLLTELLSQPRSPNSFLSLWKLNLRFSGNSMKTHAKERFSSNNYIEKENPVRTRKWFSQATWPPEPVLPTTTPSYQRKH